MRTNYLIVLIAIMAVPFISLTSVSASESQRSHYSYHGNGLGVSGSAESMVADVVIARPIGLVTTVVGSAVYVVSLPFSLLGGNEKQAREKLVKEPIVFTFKRPLGEFPSLD